jgi:hypothetical protein
VKAAVLESIGKTSKCEEFEKPEAGDGEALVRLLASSPKPVDRQLAAGTHFASPREADLPPDLRDEWGRNARGWHTGVLWRLPQAFWSDGRAYGRAARVLLSPAA